MQAHHVILHHMTSSLEEIPSDLVLWSTHMYHMHHRQSSIIWMDGHHSMARKRHEFITIPFIPFHIPAAPWHLVHLDNLLLSCV